MANWRGSRRDGTAWQPPGWKATRKRILERDGHACCICGSAGPLEIDHVIPESEGGSHDGANLWVLCVRHHREKTQQEAQRGRARLSRRRPPEKHPGLL
jgi:5-methylcytosine-specific restriction protein A